MEQSLEIRKVPIGSIYGLIQVLESYDSWKKLMSHIPKDLESKIFTPKYGTDHMILIENASIKQKRPCSEILFEEWGTSGRVRPTLGILLQILVESELFRAADIVAVDLLNSTPPKRPDKGPAAAIDVSLSQLLSNNDIDPSNIKNVTYPHLSTDSLNTSSANLVHNIPTKPFDNNQNKYLAIPISNSDNRISTSPIPSVVTKSTNVSSSASDLIQFSEDFYQSDIIDENSSGKVDIPQISMLLNDASINSNADIINSSSTSSYESSVPNLTVFQDRDEEIIPDISALQNVSKVETFNSNLNIPELSALQFKVSESNYTHPTLPVTSSSLNTILPHFSYRELQEITDNFSDHYTQNDQILARRIGEGAFGVVYLTNGLFEQPVAVKKLNFIGPSGQYSEAIISKQFKTEVEMLSKYNHAHILSLLGYSCDGPNYCVIYEYINGGSLQENIANFPTSLTPEIRMNIALDTASGIEYLHYGFPTPLIHRDIKSANILLTQTNIPKLCDFGLVKLLPNQTVTSNVMGTNAYMAPEAFRGDVSVKMDVFSFGVVLLELLTGLAPRDEDRPGVDIVTHVTDICVDGTIEPLLDKSIGLWDKAESLFSLVQICLKDKRKRPLITDIVEKLRELV